MPDSTAPTGPPVPLDEAANSDRPTSIPTFDVERYAKAQAQSKGPPKSPNPVGEGDMLELLAQGDLEGAFAACEKRLSESPTDPIAVRYEPLIRDELEASYAKSLGSLLRIPVVALAVAELARLPLDHRTGFVLSLVDGVSNFDTVLAISGMPRFEALRALSTLLRHGAISTS